MLTAYFFIFTENLPGQMVNFFELNPGLSVQSEATTEEEANQTNPNQTFETLTVDQLYLRDKESFFRNNPIKITPYSKILKIVHKLTPHPVTDPAQFDQFMREIHEKQKRDAQLASRSQQEGESTSGHEEEEETDWMLDLVQSHSFSSKKIRQLFELPTLSGILIK